MFLIIGTTIGAGYASGREIWQFFGPESGLAIGLFTIFFIMSCFVIMKISLAFGSTHYVPVLEHLIGKRLTKFYDLMIILYLFTTTIVMLAGSGATLEMFRFPYWAGIFLLAIILVVLFIWDIEGILSLNVLVLPLLISGLLFVLFPNGSSFTVNLDFSAQKNWPAAFTFTALNVLPLVAVLSAVGREMKHIGEAYIASIGSGLILGTTSFLYNESLLNVAEDLLVYEIPLFAVIEKYPYLFVLFMSAMLWVAIYTTAASGVLGLISRFRKMVNFPTWLLALLTLAMMIPFTSFGFSSLVAILYPIYGVLNLYILVALLLYPIVNHYKS